MYEMDMPAKIPPIASPLFSRGNSSAVKVKAIVVVKAKPTPVNENEVIIVLKFGDR